MKGKRALPACIPRAVVAITLILTTDPETGRAQVASASGGEDQRLAAEVGITWADVVKLVDANPAVAVGKKQVAAARAEVDAARALPNPSIAGTAAYGQARDSSLC